MTFKRLVPLVVFVALIALDRLTKRYFLSHLSDRMGPFHIIDLINHKNYGIIANVPLPRFVTITITSIAIAVIIFFIQHKQQEASFQHVLALHILLAGAIGNLWDRIHFGYVYDWLLLGGRSVVNAADIYIAIGMGWYLWSLQRSKYPTAPSL